MDSSHAIQGQWNTSVRILAVLASAPHCTSTNRCMERTKYVPSLTHNNKSLSVPTWCVGLADANIVCLHHERCSRVPHSRVLGAQRIDTVRSVVLYNVVGCVGERVLQFSRYC
jgi:hypothetical protein